MPIERFFFVSSLIWWFQWRKGSKMTPKYFILGDSNILIPFSFSTIIWLNGFLGGLKIMNSVLVTLNERRFAHYHLKTNLNSLFNIFAINFLFLWLKRIFVSSAKWCILLEVTAWCMSLMYIVNNKGPRIDPWGTLQHIFQFFYCDPLRLTNRFRFVR